MANDRMYLVCKSCKGDVYLGKTFASGYTYTNFREGTLEEQLNKFYEEHAFCDPYGKNFKIKYETDILEEK